MLADEIHTPDSSRYWLAQSYQRRFAEGRPPESLDKDFVRRWVAARCDPYRDPLPEIPHEIIAEAARLYVEAFETITGQHFDFPRPHAADPRPHPRQPRALFRSFAGAIVTDASSTIASLEFQLSEAKQQRDVLEDRVDALLMEVEFLRKHRTLRDAIAGEAIICELVEGTTTPSGFPHDVVKGKITIEVKFSNLNNTSSPSGNYTRWAWGKIFGEGGSKSMIIS